MLGKTTSQTLPRLDGQDEGETLESQFEILSIATNSCPDLSVLEMDLQNNSNSTNSAVLSTAVRHNNSDEDFVDGIFYKNSNGPTKMPLSFRRSTSLNSLTADEAPTANMVDGNNIGVMKPGNVAKVIGKLEGRVKQDFNSNSQDISPDLSSLLRSTHNGTGTLLHKSISTPSVPQIFGASGNVNSTDHLRAKNIAHLSQRGAPSIQSSISQSSKSRSFFRRKQKSKSSSINTHPPVVVQHYRNIKMESPSSYNYEAVPDEENEESIGYIALSNPALGLQDPDIESWQTFMGKDFAAQLDRKEVKRQEHMNELIVTEKHHCLNLALMHHLFVGGMKKAGYSRPARILFPGLVELLQVHFAFLKKMRERQLHFRDLGQPLDTLADLIIEQFTGENWQLMVKLYGLLCSSLTTSLELFKAMQKDSKFASLVSYWSKEPLLARKNVPECLLLVAQRITKYHLLFDALVKTAPNKEEEDKMSKGFNFAKDLNAKVNQRVREREHLIEFCQKMEPKSAVSMGKRRIRKEDLTLVPSRRLLFTGQAYVTSRSLDANSSSGGNGPGSAKNLKCNILLLTDSLVFTQELGGRHHFVSPPVLPGIVMLSQLLVRENAGQNSSLFLVLGTGSVRPEMIELQVVNPPNRDKWGETIRDAITKWQEGGENISDGDEEFLSDTVDYQDFKTARALEELQDQDRQILTLLRSRTKLVDTLRADKPRLWTANSFEGKDEVLNAVSNASSEVQKMLGQLDINNVNGVNVLRSASCASEHVISSNAGLPRRADTFGGFDSQQRIELNSQSVNNKVLFQMVIQLADLCGEMFQQMLPHLTPPTNQSQHQLQRRMEDLREAQQRLETEKAEWQRELTMQKDEIERQQTALKNKANTLQEEEKDIIQQREQLYRKLEALQRQGIRPNLDSVSPGSVSSNTSVEKSSSSVGVPPRRTVSQTQLPVTVSPQAPNTNGKPPKQQIPHFLANSTSVKSSALSPTGTGFSSSSNSGMEQQHQPLPPKPLSRGISSSLLVATKPPQPPPTSSNQQYSINQQQHSPSDYVMSSQGKGGSGSSSGSRNMPRGAQQPVQQMLPMRLSEGLKTSSLPRGVGSRSSSSMNHSHSVDQQPLIPSSTNSRLRNSSNASHVLHHSHSTGGMYAGESANPSSSSYAYGGLPANDRMSSYYKNTTSDPRKGAINGYMEFPYGMNSNNSNPGPIIHRRAGSSPVPMTSISSNPTGVSANNNTHQLPNQDDLDMSKVLFL